ncbi:alpha/beta hydrolase fold domain-containing protein [Geodermatophilaceae bacterium NBWT11]|nr:alpha/beta hydrolase fold domain-containing protein [Geodermatophilaceae bacterium NBWT11]
MTSQPDHLDSPGGPAVTSQLCSAVNDDPAVDPISTPALPPELAAVLARASRALDPTVAWPPVAPGPGQSSEQWAAEVAAHRAHHDAMAVSFSALVPPVAPSTDPAAADVEVTSVVVPVEGEGVQAAKVYRPAGDTDRPGLLLLHGGGWWMGGGATAFSIGDILCRRLAAELDVVVVNFDYRLAPEHRFPTGLDDAEAAIDWMTANAARLGVDPHRLGVYGISSGGNLAAALAHRLRATDRALCLAVLQVPVLDLRLTSASIQADPDALAGDLLRDLYLAPGTPVEDPEVSPALATDVTGLPPTIVVIGTRDSLRDDGVLHAETLAAGGIECTLLTYEMTHGVATPAVSEAWVNDVISHGRRILAATAPRRSQA